MERVSFENEGGHTDLFARSSVAPPPSPMKHVSWVRFCIAVAAAVFSSEPVSASSSSSVCLSQSNPFLFDLQSQCPLPIPRSLPIEMDGDSLDRALDSSSRNGYTAVLFYASWCPFSRGVRSKFDTLSYLFPQIIHLAFEQSSAMPRYPVSSDSKFGPMENVVWKLLNLISAYSRYGVHSVPSILLVNHKETTVRYYGPKNLQSLVHFYKEITGFEPMGHLTEDESYLSDSVKDVFQTWNLSSLKEIVVIEPYLAFATLFLMLRAAILFFPQMISRLVALWASYIPHLNLAIFGEASQLVARIIDLVDLKRAWSKLKLSKTKNFHEQAMSAQVWASSLASVSLGKTSSARASSMGGYSNE